MLYPAPNCKSPRVKPKRRASLRIARQHQERETIRCPRNP
jgi:hypothetical protein